MKKGKDGIYNRYVKRGLDIIISFPSILILSPLLIVLIIIGTIKMQGNPFFLQKRPGRIAPKTGQENIFTLIKFRTMSNAKDKDGNLLPDEQRINSYGMFLRKTSLDELAELFNILKGDMSLIGPRPLLVEYLPYYSEQERHRHDVRPGLTGWAQVNGRNTVGWHNRFLLDVEYVENIKFSFDCKIFFRTIQYVLKKQGIAEDTGAVEGNFANLRKDELANIINS